MKSQLRNRLLGAGVLTALVVIFIPMIIEEKPEPASVPNVFPTPPERQFSELDETITSNGIFTPKPIQEATPVRPILDQNLVTEDSDSGINDFDEKMIQYTDPIASTKTMPTVTSSTRYSNTTVKSTPKVGAWIVQVGSFSNKSNATRLVKKLKKNNLEAFLERTNFNNRLLYRVRVGPEISKKLAQKVQAKVVKAVNLKGKVVRYP